MRAWIGKGSLAVKPFYELLGAVHGMRCFSLGRKHKGFRLSPAAVGSLSISASMVLT